MMAGRLDREITITGPRLNRDGQNDQAETFGPIADNPVVFADPVGVRGYERYIAQQFQGEVELLFMIRWRGDITSKNRILFEGREYDILALMEVGRMEGMAINAKSRVDSAGTEGDPVTV